MKIWRFLNWRRGLMLCAVGTVTAVMVTHREGPMADHAEQGVVYVYYPSMCAAAYDPSDCREMQRPSRPGFQSMTACFAHADKELKLFDDPKVYVTCRKQRET